MRDFTVPAIKILERMFQSIDLIGELLAHLRHQISMSSSATGSSRKFDFLLPVGLSEIANILVTQ